MLGLIEEVGEFVAAREVWADHPYNTERIEKARAEMQDAIADQCIYVLNLCETAGLQFYEFETEYNNAPDDLRDAQIIGALAAACHCVLKHEQGIRGMTKPLFQEKLYVALSLWYRWAAFQPTKFGFASILESTTKVWEEVRKRDWRKNPVSANLDASQKQVLTDDLAGGK